MMHGPWGRWACTTWSNSPLLLLLLLAAGYTCCVLRCPCCYLWALLVRVSVA